MKIAHVIPNLKIGGAEKLVLDLMNQLVCVEGITCKLFILEKHIQ